VLRSLDADHPTQDVPPSVRRGWNVKSEFRQVKTGRVEDARRTIADRMRKERKDAE